jgi:hypothetical protein
MNKRMINAIFVLLTPLFLFSKVGAQSKIIDAKIDAQQIVLGDQLRYFVSATVDTTQVKLRWASFPDTFNTLEIVEKGKIDTQRNGAVVTYKQRLLITGFDSGSFLIPRFQFLSIHKNGRLDSLFSDSFRLMVNTVVVDTSKEFKAIKNIVSIQSSWLDNWPLIVVVLLTIIITAFLVVYVLNKRKNKAKEQVAELAETYHQRSLRLLYELDKKELWQQDKVKDYYTELSEIVRHYIEQRFKTNAMELTTDELLRKAKKHREMAMFRNSLKPLLEAADLAKFAKANPLPEEHIEAMQLALDFIKVSAPKEEMIHNSQTAIK